jgi:hypothetical protein
VIITYGQLAIAGVVVVCLAGLAFMGGMRVATPPEPRLPQTEKEPSFKTVQGGPTTPDLVRTPANEPTGYHPVVPEPPRPPEKMAGAVPPPKPGPAEKAPGPQKAPVTTETPTAGPQWHVQIQQFPVSESRAADTLIAYLSTKGVETDLVQSGGGFVLFSHDRFSDRKKSDEAAAQIKKHLAAFEKEKHIGVAKDAFSVQVKAQAKKE